MRIANTPVNLWANELFDILNEIGTKESYEEMMEVIRPLALEGNVPALKRASKAYETGKCSINAQYAEYIKILRRISSN